MTRFSRSAKLAVLPVAVLLSVALAACGSSSSSSSSGTGSDQPVRVAQFVVTLNTHQQKMVEGAKEEAAKLGNVSVNVFDAEFDPNKQVSQIETAVASGQYDGLLIAPVDGTRVVPAIKAATANGLKVVCDFTICGQDLTKFTKAMPELSAQTGINTESLGQEGAPVVNEACKGKDPCNLVIMTGIAALASEKSYVEALTAGLDPNVKVVAETEGQYLSDPAFKAMQDVLQTNPEVNVVFTTGDQMLVGVEQAVNDAGLGGKVALIGTGAGELGTEAVKDGHWYATAALRPINDGAVSLDYLVKAVRGETVPPVTDTQKSPLVPGGFVTGKNVNQWKPEWAG